MFIDDVYVTVFLADGLPFDHEDVNVRTAAVRTRFWFLFADYRLAHY